MGAAAKMEDSKNQRERLERMIAYLGESVIDISSEVILAEAKEAGTDPHEEAEGVRATLRDVLKTFDTVQERLSSLGHTVNPRHWWSDERGFNNNCLDCGSLVSFTIGTGEIQGKAFEEPCSESRRQASHRVYGNR